MSDERGGTINLPISAAAVGVFPKVVEELARTRKQLAEAERERDEARAELERTKGCIKMLTGKEWAKGNARAVEEEGSNGS